MLIFNTHQSWKGPGVVDCSRTWDSITIEAVSITLSSSSSSSSSYSSSSSSYSSSSSSI